MEIKRTENKKKLELTLQPQGVLNADNAAALEAEFAKLQDDVWCTVIVDLSEVPLASAAGYDMLLNAQRSFGMAGKKFVLSDPGRRLAEGLAWTGIGDYLEVVSKEDEK